MKLLVAEDNLLNQKLIQKILHKLGYKPDIVANGRDAFEAVKERNYDIILMDIQMPEVDGIEATRMIVEQVDKSRQPAIIAITANITESARESCYSAGMVDFTCKPISINKLAKILKKHHPAS